MAKSKILTPSGEIFGTDLVPVGSRIPKLSECVPCGAQVLVEILTPQEMMGTDLTVSDKLDLKVPLQGYVRAAGPSFNSESWGFCIGNRVLISGGGVMAPNYDGCHRDRFFMEPHAIKAVLVEE